MVGRRSATRLRRRCRATVAGQRNLDKQPRCTPSEPVWASRPCSRAARPPGCWQHPSAATGVIALAPACWPSCSAPMSEMALLDATPVVQRSPVGPPLVLAGVLAFRWAANRPWRKTLGVRASASACSAHGARRSGAGMLRLLEHAPLLGPVMGSSVRRRFRAGGVLAAAILTLGLPLEYCHRPAGRFIRVQAMWSGHPPERWLSCLGVNLGGARCLRFSIASTRAAKRLPLGNLLVRLVGICCAALSPRNRAEHSAALDPNSARLRWSIFTCCSMRRSPWSSWVPWGCLRAASMRWPARSGRRRPIRRGRYTSMWPHWIPATVALAKCLERNIAAWLTWNIPCCAIRWRVIYRDDERAPSRSRRIARCVDKLG